MVMGRGSDTRLYNPRSESDKMYSSANEDETKYNPASPEYNEQKREEKKLKEEEKKANKGKIKHIKIRASQGLRGEESPVAMNDSNKRDEEREIGLTGGPPGSRGNLLDLATGAKTGTGSAMTGPLPIAMSEPMDDAWSTLLKEEPTVHPGENQYKYRYNMPNRDDVHPEWYNWIQELIDKPWEYEGIGDDFTQPDIDHLAGATSREDFFDRLYDLHNFIVDDARPPFDDIEGEYRDFTDVPFNEKTGFTMSEPMDDAWSNLLKIETPRTIARRRKQEARQEFRPSTGQFKRPPGGMDPVGATMRRFKARMRGIKGGKKTGLMLPHLAVEMSHRGIATKQPMSKDPQRYRAYQGQSEARKILGNVRTTFSPHARFAQRGSYAGPTGAGRLGGLLPQQKGMMRQPSLRPLRVRAPRPPQPPMMPPMMPPQLPPVQSSVPSMPAPPSSIMMSEDRTQSDILKAKNFARHMEMLNLMRRLIAAKEREAKLKKAMQGGGSAFENGHVPDHPAGVQNNEDEDEKNDGPTQNLETNSSRMGLDPAGILISRRGHMG
jgi:hypothetical protein